MHKGFIKTAAILGMITVITGAFATHGLKGKWNDHTMETFETAVRYQFYHVIALFLSGIIFREFPARSAIWAGRMFIAGIILFSGSLYLLCFLQENSSADFKWIGAITPFGGIAFITGWALLLITFSRTNPHHTV